MIKTHRAEVLAEFVLMDDAGRRLALWVLEQYRIKTNIETQTIFDLCYSAANDNSFPFTYFKDVQLTSLVRASSDFRELIDLWRECQYNLLLTKLAFII